MKQILLTWLAAASICCAQQRTVSITVLDGTNHQPIVGAKVEYYGDSDSIFSRAIARNHRIILGFTKTDGTIEINTYPARELTELFMLKQGYAPARVDWKDNESVVKSISPWTDDKGDVVGEGQATAVDANKPVTVLLFPYKSGVVPAPIRLLGIRQMGMMMGVNDGRGNETGGMGHINGDSRPFNPSFGRF